MQSSRPILCAANIDIVTNLLKAFHTVSLRAQIIMSHNLIKVFTLLIGCCKGMSKGNEEKKSGKEKLCE